MNIDTNELEKCVNKLNEEQKEDIDLTTTLLNALFKNEQIKLHLHQ